MILIKKIIKIKYLFCFSLALGITFYFFQKDFINKNYGKLNPVKNLFKTVNVKKRNIAAQALLFNRGTSYKWNKPVKLKIKIINRTMQKLGVELVLLGTFKSDMDLSVVTVAWSFGKYTKLLEGELNLKQLDIEKNRVYSYQIRLLDVSGANQKVYLSVQSEEIALYNSVSIDTDQSLQIIEKQKLEAKKLKEKRKAQKKAKWKGKRIKGILKSKKRIMY